MVTSVMLARQITFFDNPRTKLTPSPTYCCTLFVALKKVNPFGIKQMHALWTKHPGGGVPKHFRAEPRFRRHVRHVTPIFPVPSVDCAYFPSPREWHPPDSPATHHSLPTAHFVTPLFSYSYELLFPQPLSFHIDLRCPGVWGVKRRIVSIWERFGVYAWDQL